MPSALSDSLKTQLARMNRIVMELERFVRNVRGAGIVFSPGKIIAGAGSVVLSKAGLALVPDGTAASQIRWLAAENDDEVARLFTTIVGSSPDRYGLVLLQAEPEAGSTNAASQGIVEIRAYDHDGSADDVLRGTIQLTGGAASIALNATDETVTNRLSMSQTATTLNSNNANVDTVMAGDTVADVLAVDAGLDQVLVGTSIAIKERADQQADITGYGQLWVKNTTPCQLWFTDDAGTDTQLA